MNAEQIRATDAWVLAWGQEPRPAPIPRAWRRLLSAVLAEFRAVLWSWE